MTSRFSTEKLDILLHPPQRKRLIFKSCIHSPIPIGLIRRKEIKCTKPVLDRDTNESFVVRQYEIKEVLVAISEAIATAVDPDYNGQAASVGRRVHTQVQAILRAYSSQRVISVIKARAGDISIASCLKTLIGDAVCLDDFPVRDRRLRSLPAFRPGGISDALPDIET